MLINLETELLEEEVTLEHHFIMMMDSIFQGIQIVTVPQVVVDLVQEVEQVLMVELGQGQGQGQAVEAAVR